MKNKKPSLKLLHDLGFALHWLHPQSKRPVKSKWTSGPRLTFQELKDSYQPGMNVGVRLGKVSKLDSGYLGSLDCDVKSKERRHLQEMENCLKTIITKKGPTTNSGRGNGSKHVHLRSKAPIKPRKLFESSEKVKVHMPSSKPSHHEKKTLTKQELESGLRLRSAWEISLMGEGQQLVLPPSIHPDSKRKYTWEVPIKKIEDIPWFEDTVKIKQTNLPSNGKKAEETKTEPIEFEDVDLESCGLNSDIIMNIKEGIDNIDDQSVALFITVKEMIKSNLSDNKILSILTDKKHFLGQIAYQHTKSDDRHKAAKWIQRYTLAKAKVSVNSPSNYYEIVNSFLVEKDLYRDSTPLIKFYRNKFYQFNGTHYKEAKSLKEEIIQFSQNFEKLRRKLSTSFINSIITNFTGECYLDQDLDHPFWVETCKTEKHLISFENGILDVGKTEGANTSVLIPHDYDFFSLNCLPYSYDPDAKCPTWINFLNKSLPDNEVRNFLQEWTGYNLTPDSSMQKFVVLFGEGANGKSVYCEVLRTLLGSDNISAVSLEQFDAKRTFPLAATVGKLANIVEEIGNIDTVAEGILKNYVTGSPMNVEKKRIDSQTHPMTARLTFATNVIPRFKDRTSGIWRRLTILPFPVQFKPEDQNRNLVSSDFWTKSNELPGILNWALLGRKRLYKRGYFKEPKVSVELKEFYRLEQNPAETFIRENYELKKGQQVRGDELYREYRSWADDEGITPLKKANFSKEVKRAFPSVSLSKNSLRFPDARTPVWTGLKKIEKINQVGDSDDIDYFDI